MSLENSIFRIRVTELWVKGSRNHFSVLILKRNMSTSPCGKERKKKSNPEILRENTWSKIISHSSLAYFKILAIKLCAKVPRGSENWREVYGLT